MRTQATRDARSRTSLCSCSHGDLPKGKGLKPPNKCSDLRRSRRHKRNDTDSRISVRTTRCGLSGRLFCKLNHEPFSIEYGRVQIGNKNSIMTINPAIFAKVWFVATYRDPGQHFRKRRKYTCPCCGFEGNFTTAKKRAPIPFRCPNCESRPRDRQISLYLNRKEIEIRGRNVIHFAPEWPMFRALRGEKGYVGGDIIKRKNANAIVDITNIEFENDHFDCLICNHVLEHVPEDSKAMAECFRVMKPGAFGIFTVPISENEKTWEPPEGMPLEEIEKICGWDHKRFYGHDFSRKLEAHGFEVTKFTCTPEEREKYCLLDEALFVVHKS